MGSLAEGRIGAIIVAAGAGRRFGAPSEPPKQFRELGGFPLLEWAIRPFLTHRAIGPVLAVLPREIASSPPEWVKRADVMCVAGGEERVDSVRLGLAALPGEVERVLVHDGARPFPSHDLIDRIVSAAMTGAAVPGVPVTDTVKEVDGDGFVIRTVAREGLRRIQTPQAFPVRALREVHRKAHEVGLRSSDDAALFEHYGYPVRVVDGEDVNIKVTTRTDFAIAEAIAHRLRAPG